MIVTVLVILLMAATVQAAVCTLSWDANAEPDVVGYYVYHRLDGATYSKGNPIGYVSGMTTMTCEALGIGADDQTHYFTVTAYNGLESEFSNEVSTFLAVPPPPPPSEPVCRRWLKNGRCWKW